MKNELHFLSVYSIQTSHNIFPIFSYLKVMAKIKIDLHDVFNNSKSIDHLLIRALNDAIEKNIKIVEIIPGKGSGQLKKRVLRFLDQSHIKKMYKRVDKDSKNFGKLLVRF